MGILKFIYNSLQLTCVLWLTVFTLSEIMCFPKKINPQLNEILLDFVQDAADHGVDVDPITIGSLEYGDLEYPDIGQTYRTTRFGHEMYLPFGTRIIIQRAPWSSEYLRLIVYHELGHALLKLDHEPLKFLGAPADKQIMNATIPNVAEFDGRWRVMVDHLFKDGKVCLDSKRGLHAIFDTCERIAQ